MKAKAKKMKMVDKEYGAEKGAEKRATKPVAKKKKK